MSEHPGRLDLLKGAGVVCDLQSYPALILRRSVLPEVSGLTNGDYVALAELMAFAFANAFNWGSTESHRAAAAFHLRSDRPPR